MADGPGQTPQNESLERIRSLEHTVTDLTRELARLRAEVRALEARPNRENEQRTSDAGDAASATLFYAQRTEYAAYLPQTPREPAPTEQPVVIDAKMLASADRAARAGRLEMPPRSAPTRPRRSFADFEALVGRYGMLALATVAALAGVGTFLSWMISRGMLSPGVRVVLGLVTAGALAVCGYRLRRRERSFGSNLLGLALAITHVCAWASGPSLQLVPAIAAFALASVASIALALFAHREHDETLWCVGYGGAALAPFVTSDGRSQAVLLAAYGAMVLLTGCWALRRRSWTMAERTLAFSSALFVGGLAAMPERSGGPLLAVALPFVIALGGALPFAARSRLRARLRTLGALGAAAAVRAAFESNPVFDQQWLAIALGVAGLAWLALVDHSATLPASARVATGDRSAASTLDWFDACFIPATYLAAVIVGLSDIELRITWTLTGALLAWFVFVARRPAGHLRDAAAFAAALASLLAAYAASVGHAWLTSGCATMAVGFAFAHRIWPSRSWLLAALLTLVGCAASAIMLLMGRVPFAYSPFGTIPSAVALVVALSWIVTALYARTLAAAQRAADDEQGIAHTAAREREMELLVQIVRGTAAAVTFVWINLELSGAFSPTTAKLLVISYYAASGVACVGVGRRFDHAVLRRVGLTLAVLGALVAFQGASHIGSIAARIPGYLVTAVFLLGIAYWYRRPGAEPEVELAEPEPELAEASRS